MNESLNGQHIFSVSRSNLDKFVKKINNHKANGWHCNIAWIFQDYSIYSSPDKNYFTIIVNEYGHYPFMINELYEFYEKEIQQQTKETI